MNHTMSLDREPFSLIQRREKVFELRCDDEKRRALRIGDTVTFFRRPLRDESLCVRVTSLHRAASFRELAVLLPAAGTPDGLENGMRRIYTPEEEARFSVLAIGIELLDHSMCGYRCSGCAAFAPNIAAHDDRAELSRMWKKYFGLDVPPQRIGCDGCRCFAAGARLADDGCPVRPCVIGKDLSSCAGCESYPCRVFETRRGLNAEEARAVAGDCFDRTEYDRFVSAYDNKTRLDDEACLEKRKALVRSYLGQTVDVMIDRPVGYVHKKADRTLVYPINYGYIPGVLGGDGEELDVYVLGEAAPLEKFRGRVVGIVHRTDDAEDKLVAAPNGMEPTEAEIASAVRFQERYYDSHIEALRDQ